MDLFSAEEWASLHPSLRLRGQVGALDVIITTGKRIVAQWDQLTPEQQRSYDALAATWPSYPKPDMDDPVPDDFLLPDENTPLFNIRTMVDGCITRRKHLRFKTMPENQLMVECESLVVTAGLVDTAETALKWHKNGRNLATLRELGLLIEATDFDENGHFDDMVIGTKTLIAMRSDDDVIKLEGVNKLQFNTI